MANDDDVQPNKDIAKLLYTKDTNRVYELSNGEFEERSGGSASWRHNNPGNLKVEYANSADSTVHTNRTKEHALESAKSHYDGVVDLDQRGNVIFDSYDHGRAAQISFIQSHGNDKTVSQMLGDYSKPDYSGPTHYKQQEDMIYKTGDAAGVDLRTKKISDMTDKEISSLADGISKFEGWHEGKAHSLTAKQVSDLQAGVKEGVLSSDTGHARVISEKVLHQGDQGDEVKRVQGELKDLGYLQGDIDGRFGPATKGAVERFQREQGLTPDGKIGAISQHNLDSALRDKQISGMSFKEGAQQLRDFSDPGHPQNALYSTLREGFPRGASPELLTQATGACYMSGIKRPDDLGNVYGDGQKIMFLSNSPLASTAIVNTTIPPPSVQQTMQHVQQHDQQQAQMMGQIQAQNAQINQQTQQSPMPGGRGR